MSNNIPITDELLRRAKEGDKAALGQLLGHYRPDILTRADAGLGNDLNARTDASDVAQNVLLEISRKFLEQFRGDTIRAFEAWLRPITRHACVHVARFHRRQERDVTREQRLD